VPARLSNTTPPRDGAIKPNFIPLSLFEPAGLALSGNNLLVANFGKRTVVEYNVTTGAVINANFITGLSGKNYGALHSTSGGS
jgi:hypothetical protein